MKPTRVTCESCGRYRRGGEYSFWYGTHLGTQQSSMDWGTSVDVMTTSKFRVHGHTSAAVCRFCVILFGVRHLALAGLVRSRTSWVVLPFIGSTWISPA